MTEIRKVVNGTVVSQVRFSKAFVEQLLVQAAIDNGLDVAMPDFGEGEADSVSVQIRPITGNQVFGTVGADTELVLVVTDEENDPAFVPEPVDPPAA